MEQNDLTNQTNERLIALLGDLRQSIQGHNDAIKNGDGIKEDHLKAIANNEVEVSNVTAILKQRGVDSPDDWGGHNCPQGFIWSTSANACVPDL